MKINPELERDIRALHDFQYRVEEEIRGHLLGLIEPQLYQLGDHPAAAAIRTIFRRSYAVLLDSKSRGSR